MDAGHCSAHGDGIVRPQRLAVLIPRESGNGWKPRANGRSGRVHRGPRGVHRAALLWSVRVGRKVRCGLELHAHNLVVERLWDASAFRGVFSPGNEIGNFLRPRHANGPLEIKVDRSDRVKRPRVDVGEPDLKADKVDLAAHGCVREHRNALRPKRRQKILLVKSGVLSADSVGNRGEAQIAVAVLAVLPDLWPGLVHRRILVVPPHDLHVDHVLHFLPKALVSRKEKPVVLGRDDLSHAHIVLIVGVQDHRVGLGFVSNNLLGGLRSKANGVVGRHERVDLRVDPSFVVRTSSDPLAAKGVNGRNLVEAKIRNLARRNAVINVKAGVYARQGTNRTDRLPLSLLVLEVASLLGFLLHPIAVFSHLPLEAPCVDRRFRENIRIGIFRVVGHGQNGRSGIAAITAKSCECKSKEERRSSDGFHGVGCFGIRIVQQNRSRKMGGKPGQKVVRIMCTFWRECFRLFLRSSSSCVVRDGTEKYRNK
mmetsp:Transcript_3819/g.9252  ORF Transcript_3819/g.9252 Transcript_3819/m.9252 type:complete len:482 (-) Transcript_3819:167-1612(-)